MVAGHKTPDGKFHPHNKNKAINLTKKGSVRFDTPVDFKNARDLINHKTKAHPTQKVTDIVSFDELDESAKDRAREWFKEGHREWDGGYLEDLLQQQLEYELEENKIEVINRDAKVRYSLGYSQGDGASFRGKFLWKGHVVTVEPTTNQYVHENTMGYTMTDEETGEENGSIKLDEQFDEIAKKISKNLEKYGYDELRYQEGDEYVDDAIESNEYTFDRDGNRENA